MLKTSTIHFMQKEWKCKELNDNVCFCCKISSENWETACDWPIFVNQMLHWHRIITKMMKIRQQWIDKRFAVSVDPKKRLSKKGFIGRKIAIEKCFVHFFCRVYVFCWLIGEWTRQTMKLTSTEECKILDSCLFSFLLTNLYT